MLHKIIGSKAITTPFLRFTTGSGSGLDPTFTAASATFQWINPDGSISTGTTPNPALDQIGAHVVKCSDWSDVTHIDFRTDNITAVSNLQVLTAVTDMYFFDCDLSELNISGLTTLEVLYCNGNSIPSLDLAGMSGLTTVYCYNNTMVEAAIDQILADLVANGANNGTVSMTGTNMAAPSAAGDADVLILEGRGWTVTTS